MRLESSYLLSRVYAIDIPISQQCSTYNKLLDMGDISSNKSLSFSLLSVNKNRGVSKKD